MKRLQWITSKLSQKYATQASAATKRRSQEVKAATTIGKIVPKEDLKTTTLPNGLVIASVENYSPVSRISIVFKAGARNETLTTQGITHVIRSAAGLGSTEASYFGITRNIQQIGGSVSCSGSREYISYSLRCIRSNTETGLNFLKQIAARQKFRPWELEENKRRLLLDIARISPEIRALENAHKAVFRNGLANSLYINEFEIERYEQEELAAFVAENFLAGQTAVVGLGVEHQQLVDYSKTFKLPKGTTKTDSPKYGVSELRNDGPGKLAYVVLATEGASWKNPKDVATSIVLRNILGSGPSVKWGGESGSKLYKAVNSVASEPFAVAAVNLNYSDAGLFGLSMVTKWSEADKTVPAAMKALRDIAPSEADLARAKTQAKAALLESSITDNDIAAELGIQAIIGKQLTTIEELERLIEAVNIADVTAAAKKVGKSKISLAAEGRISKVPYLDQLG